MTKSAGYDPLQHGSNIKGIIKNTEHLRKDAEKLSDVLVKLYLRFQQQSMDVKDF